MDYYLGQTLIFPLGFGAGYGTFLNYFPIIVRLFTFLYVNRTLSTGSLGRTFLIRLKLACITCVLYSKCHVLVYIIIGLSKYCLLMN